jgi:UDP-N-acetylmuramate dehydrogenase
MLAATLTPTPTTTAKCMLIHWNKSLKAYNTFGIDARAKMLTTVESVEDLQRVLRQPKLKDELKLVIGGGSNLLFTQDFPGLVIHNDIKGFDVVKEDAYHTWVKAGAGEVWHDFVLRSLEMGLSGIENLSLIPGRCGAAPMQNIGAYGVELKETFDSLEAVDIDTGALVTFDNAACEFGYRESVFKNKHKGKYVITSVTLRLNKVFKPHVEYGDIKKTLDDMHVSELTPQLVSEAVIKIRQSKLPDPAVIGNAGSFFKNPSIPTSQYKSLQEKNPLMPGYPQADNTVKVPAGWLIEQCGWKGKQVGNTGSHKQQALVLVNYGNASGIEVLTLAQEIHNSVLEKFGIEIIPEVNVV